MERLLGEGGFGRVFLAHDDELKRSVAIKVPHRHLVTKPKHADSYRAEARALASLDHPNIVPVHDVGRSDDGLPFVVSKFIEGIDLAKRMKAEQFSFAAAAELIATMAEALHYAHGRGLVHRDIKPGNILIDAKGKPFVVDFGLALKEEDFGKSSRYAGTPSYMSPEQARGDGHRVDGRSDIFSLGVVFYELLTRRRPFTGQSVREILDQVTAVEARPPRQVNDAIPKELERICLKALAKRPTERFTTAKDMAEELREFLPIAATANAKAVVALPVSNEPAASPAPDSVNESVFEVDSSVVKLAPIAGRFQNPTDHHHRFWRRATVVAVPCLLLAMGLGVAVFLNWERIKRVGGSETLLTQVVNDLKDESPSDDAFLKKALPKLQTAIKSKRDVSKEKVFIQGLLERKLKTKLDHAIDAAKGNGDGGKAIDSWLALVGEVPAEFQSERLAEHQQSALLSYPLTPAQDSQLQKFVEGGEFREALVWSASQRQSQSLESQIRTRWLAKAKEKYDRVDPTGLKDLLDCHVEIPRGAAEMKADVSAALNGYLVKAENLLSGSSDNWPGAATLYRDVQAFLAQNAKTLDGPGVAVAQFKNTAVLGELCAELRQKDESQADWQSLNGRLVDPGDDTAQLATRYKLLLASFAEKLTPSPATEPISKVPLLDDKVLDALVSLAEGAALNDWESNKFSRLQSRLQTILEENRGQLVGSTAETKILAINKNAAFLLALLRAEDALRLAKPDLAAAAKSLQEAAGHEGKATVQDGNRMKVLQLWHFLADPSGHATEAGFPQVGPGLELFINSSPSTEFDAGFLDALHAASLGSPQLSRSIVSIAASAEQSAVNRRLLVEAQARFAETRRALEGDSPDWAKLHTDWLPLIKQQAVLESSPQAVASPYRIGLVLFYAAFLEASASQSALPALDEHSRFAFDKLQRNVEPQGAAAVGDDENADGTGGEPERDYLRYIRDLALETWPGLKKEGADDANRFLMEAKSVKFLKAPFRRAQAAKSLLARVKQMDLPQDDRIITTLSEQKSQAAIRLLEGILTWVDQTEEAAEARARLGIVLAHGTTTPKTWEHVRDLTDALSVPEYAEQWQKEKIWGHLLLANAQGHYENRREDASRRRAILQFGRLTHLVMNLSETQEQLSDADWCQRIWLPCKECIGNPTMKTSPPMELEEAYTSILGTLGTILERDRFRQVSRDLFDELNSPDLPIQTRRDSFHAASELEKDVSRRARWLVGEGRAIRDLSDNNSREQLQWIASLTVGSEREQLELLASLSMDEDPKYHGCHELAAHLRLIRSRGEPAKAKKMEHLDSAALSCAKAVELVKRVSFEQEREPHLSAYLEEFSQIHLEKAFISARGPEQMEYLRTAEKAARASALECPDRLRNSPERAYVAWGNALEDMAWHAGCLDYFAESESKLENAVTLANSSLAKAYAKMNLGRVQFRHAVKAKLKPEAHQHLRDAAQENLNQALSAQLAAKRLSEGLLTEYYLAQIDHTMYLKETADVRRVRLSKSVERYDRLAVDATTIRPDAWVLYRSGAAEAARSLANDYYYLEPKDTVLGAKYDKKAQVWARKVIDAFDSRITSATVVVMAKILIETDQTVRKCNLINATDESFAAKTQILTPILERLESKLESADSRIGMLLQASEFPCRAKENFAIRQDWIRQAEVLTNHLSSDELRYKQCQVAVGGAKARIKCDLGAKAIAESKNTEGFAELKSAVALLFGAIKQADDLQTWSLQITCNCVSEPRGERGILPIYDSITATKGHRRQLHDVLKLLRLDTSLPNKEKRHYLISARDALVAIRTQNVDEVEFATIGSQIADLTVWLTSLEP